MLNIPLLGRADPYQSARLVLDWAVSSGSPYFKAADGSRYASFAAMVAAGKATFTRAGAGTAQRRDGTVVSFASGVPRETDQGLLIEESRTNLILNSASMSTQTVTDTAVAYTLSFYGTGSIVYSGGASGALAGTGANNRVSATFTPTAGALVLTVSGSVNNAQLEAGAFATSWIPTTSAAATRPADNAFITGLGSILAAPVTMTGWGNLPVASDGVNRNILQTNDGTSNNRTFLLRDTTNSATANEVIGGVFEGGYSIAGKTGIQLLKLAARYRASAFNASLNGAAVGNGTTTGFPAGMNRLDIGQGSLGGASYLNGYIQKIVIQGDVADDQLRALTR